MFRQSTLSALFLSAFTLFGARVEAGGQTDRSRPQIAAVRLGIANHYKVGHWTPVWVDVEAASALDEMTVEVTAVDSDGVSTMASAPLQPAASPDARPMALVYTKIGRLGGSVRITLNDGDRQLDVMTVQPGAANGGRTDIVEMPATSELAVIMGAATFDMKEAFGDRNAADGHATRRAVRAERVDQLPSDWVGYEAINVLIIAADDSALWRDLVADETRYAALVRWIELGGRLVILCGGDDAPQMLAPGGPLAALVPGKLADVVRLPETSQLEQFANSEAPIAGRNARTAIAVPRLVDVDGNIEVYAGRRPADLPLVVRSARGLGEITFVGVDFTDAPLAEWSGRTKFLKAVLRPYFEENGSAADAPQTLVTRGYNDLSGAMRQRLGHAFASVAPISFPLVTALAMAYMLVLGPIDYFVVHRWLRRRWAAWITFPLIVIVFGFAAFAIADWRKGTSVARVNRLELVDIDATTGQARGTFWAALYSPHADQFNVSLDIELLAPSAAAPPEARLSWWGLPGVGIGGMQAGGTGVGIMHAGYRYADGGDALENVPVLTSATKSLMARWTASVAPLIDAQLVDEEGMITGSVVNRTGRPLRNLRLFYNGWAYVLGNVEPGGRVDLSDENSPRRMKTIVTQSALGTNVPGRSEGTVFVAERASAEQILNLMMFYEAGGGYGFARLPNDYLAFCDLSRLPDLGRAVLVADVQTRGSRLMDADSGQPLGDEQDAAAVVYRFVLPVERQ